MEGGDSAATLRISGKKIFSILIKGLGGSFRYPPRFNVPTFDSVFKVKDGLNLFVASFALEVQFCCNIRVFYVGSSVYA